MASAKGLLCASAVRRTAVRMLLLARRGLLNDWKVDLHRLPDTADFVTKVILERYPLLNPNLHSRWRHFVFERRDLWNELDQRTRWPSPASRARAMFDLVITSVLLDAGAGPDWHYHDGPTGLDVSRSEGLALAHLRWFESGGLADDGRDPLRADAAALRRIDTRAFSRAFQVTSTNQLLGVEGRVSLLRSLGAVLESRPELFATADTPRPGGLFDALYAHAADGRLQVDVILETLLEVLAPIWPHRPKLAGVPLGDCWPHPALIDLEAADRHVPLHKLPQWLTYSLVEPLEAAGVRVTALDHLTGLAEYRNGGLLIDTGVLVPLEPDALSRTYEVSDPFVVGWRALTVALLDELNPYVCARLGFTTAEFPLTKLMEGGTWAAGRVLARQKRPNGTSPIKVSSDGTVF